MIYKNGIFLRWNFFTILFLLFIYQKFVNLKDRIIFNRDFTWMSETYSPADPNSLILMSQDVLLRHSNDISMIQKHTRSLVYSYIYKHNRFKLYFRHIWKYPKYAIACYWLKLRCRVGQSKRRRAPWWTLISNLTLLKCLILIRRIVLQLIDLLE